MADHSEHGAAAVDAVMPEDGGRREEAAARGPAKQGTTGHIPANYDLRTSINVIKNPKCLPRGVLGGGIPLCRGLKMVIRLGVSCLMSGVSAPKQSHAMEGCYRGPVDRQVPKTRAHFSLHKSANKCVY